MGQFWLCGLAYMIFFGGFLPLLLMALLLFSMVVINCVYDDLYFLLTVICSGFVYVSLCHVIVCVSLLSCLAIVIAILSLKYA